MKTMLMGGIVERERDRDRKACYSLELFIQMGISFPLCSGMLLTKATMSNMVLSKRCQTQNTLVYDFKSQQHSSIVSEVRHAATFEAE